METDFVINTDRLRDGKKLTINCELSSEFLKTEDSELQFESSAQIEGQAYVVDHQLIVKVGAQVSACLNCKICNQKSAFPIDVKNFYHVEDLKELKTPYFNCGLLLRQEILLEVPQFIECNEGKCPERELISQYFEQESLKEN